MTESEEERIGAAVEWGRAREDVGSKAHRPRQMRRPAPPPDDVTKHREAPSTGRAIASGKPVRPNGSAPGRNPNHRLAGCALAP